MPNGDDGCRFCGHGPQRSLVQLARDQELRLGQADAEIKDLRKAVRVLQDENDSIRTALRVIREAPDAS